MASYYIQNPNNYSTNTPSSGSFSSSSSMASTNKSKKSGGGGGGKKSKAVKLSTDPQSIAARQRRHRISDRFKTLQSLVPGGSKLDTVSMLEEAIQYVKFLKNQIWIHQSINMNATVSGSDYHVPDHKCNVVSDQLALVQSGNYDGESEVCFGSNDDFFAQMQLSELPCPVPEPCLHFQGQNGNFDCFGW